MRRPSTSEREFDKELNALEAVFEFLDDTLSGTALDDRGRFVLELAVEELFTNIVKYGSDLSGRVAVRVTSEPDRVRVDIVDPNTHDFDPTRMPAVDTTRPIQERKRGGLGLHLVREMADGVEYRYRDREMTVSVTKHLE